MYTWILGVFFTVFLKNRNISSKIKRSKVTDYAALIIMLTYSVKIWSEHFVFTSSEGSVVCADLHGTLLLDNVISTNQSELPRPIPRNFVESDHGCTSRIYFDNAGDNVTPTLYNVTFRSQKQG